MSWADVGLVVGAFVGMLAFYCTLIVCLFYITERWL